MTTHPPTPSGKPPAVRRIQFALLGVGVGAMLLGGVALLLTRPSQGSVRPIRVRTEFTGKPTHFPAAEWDYREPDAAALGGLTVFSGHLFATYQPQAARERGVVANAEDIAAPTATPQIVEIDGSGTLVRRMALPPSDCAYRFAPSAALPSTDGGFIVAGMARDDLNNTTLLVQSLAVDGSVRWEQRYPQLDATYTPVLHTDDEGGCWLAADLSPGWGIAHLDVQGAIRESRVLFAPTGLLIGPPAVVLDAAGGYRIAAVTWTGERASNDPTPRQLMLYRRESFGTPETSSYINTFARSSPCQLALAENGDCLLTYEALASMNLSEAGTTLSISRWNAALARLWERQISMQELRHAPELAPAPIALTSRGDVVCLISSDVRTFIDSGHELHLSGSQRPGANLPGYTHFGLLTLSGRGEVRSCRSIGSTTWAFTIKESQDGERTSIGHPQVARINDVLHVLAPRIEEPLPLGRPTPDHPLAETLHLTAYPVE